MKVEVAFDIRTIFNSPDLTETKRMLELVAKKYEKVAPNLSKWMEENLPEGFTVFGFPRDHWRRLGTNNGLGRTNREIARRKRWHCL